jgi:hypothetical protein
MQLRLTFVLLISLAVVLGKLQIIEGYPQQYGSSQPGYIYFQYNLAGSDNILFGLDLEYGLTSVYVSTTNPTPSSADYTWKADRGNQTIAVRTTDKGYVPNGVYYVAVYCQTGYTTFYLYGVRQHNYLFGSLYYTLPSQVRNFEYVYYQYRNWVPGASFTVGVVDAFDSSSVDMYITTQTPPPSATNYEYANTNYGNKYINVYSALNTTYYIGFLGNGKYDPNRFSVYIKQL